MEKNVGVMDRRIRIILAVLFFAGSYFYPGYRFLLLFTGIILAFTAYTNFCGIYKVFGINTRK